MATRDPISYATHDPDTGKPIMTKEEAAALRNRKPIEKRGMLIVTTFRNQDIPLLRKRVEWFSFLGVVPEYDLLLVGDYDVAQSDLKEMQDLHAPFFKQVQTKRIKEPPRVSSWPDNCNTAFRKTYKTLIGQYDNIPKFSWAPYTGWFYFEADVTILKPNAFALIEAIYRDGKKPFCGFLNETRLSDNRLVRHINGAAVYPTRNDSPRYYNEKMMLTVGLPWDVAGMGDGLLGFSSVITSDKYMHAFGTWNYSKEGNELTCRQKLMTGAELERKFLLNGHILHHGCKDGSLIDVLMKKVPVDPKEEKIWNENGAYIAPPVIDVKMNTAELVTGKVVMPGKLLARLTVEDPEKSEAVKADMRSGIKWKQLITKHKISPKQLKAIKDECGN